MVFKSVQSHGFYLWRIFRRGKNSADQKAIFDLQWQAKHSVNNVAPCTGKPAVDYTAQESFWHISTNPEPSFHFSQLAYPLLEASGAGIMFISSVAGIVSLQWWSVYEETKAATNHLTKNLAWEWAKDNIRVNSVAPWFVRTLMVEYLINEPEFLKKIESKTPFRRVGEPEEVSYIPGCFPLSPCCFLHHWTGYSCWWRINCDWLQMGLINWNSPL